MTVDGTFRLGVAPGVHLVEHGHTNCYVVEADEGLTLVDAGYRRTWQIIERCLHAVEREPSEIAGLIITHGHFDHVGFASSVQQRFSIPVWVHSEDQAILRHPYRYRPAIPRLLTPLTHPRSWPVLAGMIRAGALRSPGCEPDRLFDGADTAPLPGAPAVIHTPGHTDGECVIHLRDRQALITGDALVTLDPYTGERGPRIISRSATHDSVQALESLRRLSGLEATTVLPGHGEVWAGGIAAAVEQAWSNHRDRRF